ncbi:P-type conjugative transfer protein TrbG (plasmid) [Citrobacter sp. OP27]
MRTLLLPALLVASSCAFAQAVPALQASVPTSSPASMMLGQQQPLSPKERQSLALVNKWINGTGKPITKGDGSVTWFFGTTMPTVVCAPLKTCDIALQPGERITKKGVHIGDPVRWDVSPALSGEGDTQITHLIVKPADVGLSTTLMIATDRRTYHLSLVSRKNDWTPEVNFDYPEDVKSEWDSYYAKQAAVKAQKTLGDGLNIDSLDFGYSISGSASFKPLRVYNNSIKTIIEMPASVASRELPTLVVVNAGEQEVVNYRFRDNKFIVDQLADEIMLIAGVGSNQQSILIKHQGGS